MLPDPLNISIHQTTYINIDTNCQGPEKVIDHIYNSLKHVASPTLCEKMLPTHAM